MCDILFVVIPCYNEEEVLVETAKRLHNKMALLIEQGLVNEKSRILFVNDGSTDKTWEIIRHFHQDNNLFSGLCLSRNKGQQNATYAGLMTAKNYADVVITMDADLQDNIDTVDKMLGEYEKGFDVVYGVRSSRKNDPFIRRVAAASFYRVIRLIGVNVVYNHSAYRLLSRRAVEALEEYPEVNLFLPGIVPLLGYKSTIVAFEKKERFAGTSKYSIPKLFSLAIEAITSFSLKPLRLISLSGILFILISALIVICSIVNTVSGTFDEWLLVLSSVLAVGGTVLLSVGIVGEYIGKTYMETKRRPRYHIAEALLDNEDS